MPKVLATVAAVLVLLGCSDGGGDGGRAPDPAQDLLIAEAALLQQTDLPTYVQKQGVDAGSTDPSGGECVRKAANIDAATIEAGRTAVAKRTFSTDSGLNKIEVGGTVELNKDDHLLSTQLDAFLQPGVTDCLVSEFQNSFGEQGIDVPQLTITASKLDGVGDQGVTLLLKGRIESPGFSAAFSSDVSVVRVGRASVSVSVTRFNGDADHDLGVRAVTTMVKRLKL